jgi:malate synthase
MTDMIRHGDIEIARILYAFVNDEALPGTGVSPDHFWDGAGRIINALAPKARALVAERTALQGAIDDWHKARRGQPHDADEYRAFLADIGYLAPGRRGLHRRHGRRRRRDRPHRRPPARRADEQCALFPQCRQRPLGLAL